MGTLQPLRCMGILFTHWYTSRRCRNIGICLYMNIMFIYTLLLYESIMFFLAKSTAKVSRSFFFLRQQYFHNCLKRNETTSFMLHDISCYVLTF